MTGSAYGCKQFALPCIQEEPDLSFDEKLEEVLQQFVDVISDEEPAEGTSEAPICSATDAKVESAAATPSAALPEESVEDGLPMSAAEIAALAVEEHEDSLRVADRGAVPNYISVDVHEKKDSHCTLCHVRFKTYACIMILKTRF